MTPDRGPGADAAARREALINDLLDSALTHNRSREAYECLRGDAAACEDLARLRFAVARLSAPVDVPDLSGSILGRVDSRRRFLSRRRRGLVTAGRVGIAAGVVVAVGLASFVQRSVPQLRAAESVAPVGRVVETAQRSAQEQSQLIETTVETIQSSLASPVARLSLCPSYRLEEEVSFSLTINPPQPGARLPAVPAPTTAAPLASLAPAAPIHQAAASAPNPFIDRFGPLLVILRDPKPPIDDADHPADDR